MLRFLWFLPAEKCRPCNRSSPAAEDFPTLKNSFWEVMGTSYRREDLPSLCSDRKEPLSQLHKKRPDPNVKAALTPLASSFLPYRSCQCFSWLQAHKQDGLGTGIASWLSCSCCVYHFYLWQWKPQMRLCFFIPSRLSRPFNKGLSLFPVQKVISGANVWIKAF